MAGQGIARQQARLARGYYLVRPTKESKLQAYPEEIRKLFLGNGKRNQKVKPATLFRKNHKEQAIITMERNEYAIDEQESEPYRLTMDDAAFMLLGYRNPRMFSD